MIDFLKASDDSLWCKPSKVSGDAIFTKQLPESGLAISFRSVDVAKDLEMLHRWMNAAYSKRFWQLNRSVDVIKKIYTGMLCNHCAHSFVGEINGKPVCLIDLYMTLTDELADHVPVSDSCGMHLLMCPPREMQKDWSLLVLKAFQQFYFSFPRSQWLFAEPDIENYHANRLALRAGFTLIRTIQLSYKTANLYAMFRNDFLKLNS